MGKKMRSPKVDKQGQRGQNARSRTVVMGSSELTGTQASDCTIRLRLGRIRARDSGTGMNGEGFKVPCEKARGMDMRSFQSKTTAMGQLKRGPRVKDLRTPN